MYKTQWSRLYFSLVLSFVFHVALSNSSLTPDEDIVFEDFARLRLKGIIDKEEDCWISSIISFIKSRSASHLLKGATMKRFSSHYERSSIGIFYWKVEKKIKDLSIYIWKANEERDSREFCTFLHRHVKILILCQLLCYERQANL